MGFVKFKKSQAMYAKIKTEDGQGQERIDLFTKEKGNPFRMNYIPSHHQLINDLNNAKKVELPKSTQVVDNEVIDTLYNKLFTHNLLKDC
jgi:elongation factor P--beta-lysine ligase